MTNKERLASAKFKKIKEYYSAMGGLDPDIQEDMRWLINRVEELEMKLSINTNNMKQLQKENECYKQLIEELEKELTHQTEHFDICYHVIEKEKKVAEEQNKRYKQALEFYADEENYCVRFEDDYEPILKDNGKIARKALKGE